MLRGRLGLETARIPHADRHGLVWLSRGQLTVSDGTLQFCASGNGELASGIYDIPYQGVSLLLLGPGVSLTHDVLRLCARHGTGIAAVGDNGTRFYTAPPRGPDHSALARRQAVLWADPDSRIATAIAMYAIRLGEAPARADIAALRGMEGARVREMYKLMARQYGIPWEGRRYNRNAPEETSPVNMAVNHAAVATRAAAEIAVAATATIPQLGFIHEDSSISFALDIADLFRDEFTLPVAFQGYKRCVEDESLSLEREVRKLAGASMRRQGLIPAMIERIKEIFDAHDSRGHP